MSLSTLKDCLLKFGKSVMEYEVASISLLELAKSLPAFQLSREHQLRAVVYTRFPSPVFKKFLVLPRMIEDLKPKFDRVARSTIIINKSVIRFPLSP